MAFKDLHKLKKITVVEKEFIEVPHLVVGKDIFALSIYNELKNKYGPDKVRLLSEDIIFKSDLLPKGPSTFRGEANKKIIYELYPDAISEISSERSLFYKDMTWKSFGGRSKSETLKFSEEFFTTSRFKTEMEIIFPELKNYENYLAAINLEAYQVRLKSICRAGDKFKVECINGTEFLISKLYFGHSPSQYLKFYSEKNEFSDAFIEFCENTKTTSAICMKFIFEKPIVDIKETLFIPLSYTHEWGHFIGEFNVNSHENDNEQEVEFIHFLDENHESEEDVSKVIHLLKKSMEKIFENFSRTNVKENIILEQSIGCLKIDDDLFLKSQNETKNLFFLGINSPIGDIKETIPHFEYSKEEVCGLARALLTYSIFLKELESP